MAQLFPFIALIGMASATIVLLKDYCPNQTDVTVDRRFCEFGPHNPCRVTYEPNMCRRTYGCFNLSDYLVNRTMACKFACAFMNLGARRYLNPAWDHHLLPPNWVQLGVEYRIVYNGLLGDEVYSRDTHEFESQVYGLLFWYNNLQVYFARLYDTNGCISRNMNWNRNDICTNATKAAQNRVCRRDKTTGCYLDKRFLSEANHCTRVYRCTWVAGPTNKVPKPGKICGTDCWLTHQAFYDFQAPGNPSEDKVDVFLEQRDGENVTRTNKFVDVSRRNATLAASEFFLDTFRRDWHHLRITIAVTARWCVKSSYALLQQGKSTAERQPTICPGVYHVSPRLRRYRRRSRSLNFAKLCQGGAPMFARHSENSTEVLQSDRCWVEIRCNYGTFYRTFGWSRYDYCYFSKRLFRKSLSWLRVDVSASNAEGTMEVVIEHSADNDVEKRLVEHGPLKSMYARYDRFMFFHGFQATKMVITQQFNSCLQATNGRLRTKIQGTDHCPHANYSKTKGGTVDGCHIILFNLTGPAAKNTVKCSFSSTDSNETRCLRLYWLLYRSLYMIDIFNFTALHSTNPMVHIEVNYTTDYEFLTSENNSESVRRISPVLRDRAEPYIKNFLVEVFYSLKALEFKTIIELM